MIRVYQYGCVVRDPIPPEASAQLRLANDLWNRCVEIDRRHQESMREIMASAPDMARLVAEREHLGGRLEELRGNVKSARQKARKRTAIDSAIKAAIAEVRAALKANTQAIREARELAGESVRPLLAENETLRRSAIKSARQASAAEGLYWGTYNAVVQSYDLAHQHAWQDGDQLRFRRWDGAGRWAVQIQTETGDEPTRIADVEAGRCRVLQIERPAEEWEEITAKNGATVRRRRLPVVRLRIGSDARRRPVWLEVPVKLHRPIPASAQITGAVLVRERIGAQWRHRLNITVREADSDSASPALPIVAVDVGWRVMPDGGLRVGYALGSDGWSLDMRCPERTRGALRTANGLRSLRDREFNAARDRLADWLEEAPHVPVWMRERTRTIRRWRSPEALRRLCEDWREQPFPRDEEEHAALEAWRSRYVDGRSDGDLHHLAYEAHSRDQALAHRRDVYRTYAADIARRSSAVVLETFDLRDLLKRPEAEEEVFVDAYRVAARQAAVGELRQAIRQACATRGVPVREVPSKDTTRVHHRCGHLIEQDYAADVRVYCPVCGEWYDQDANAAANLLDARGPGADSDPDGARGPSGSRPRGRFQRAKEAAEKAEQERRSHEESEGAGAQGA